MDVFAIHQLPKVDIPVFEKLPVHEYRVRWRFDFANSPTKRGVWDASSQNELDDAWVLRKAGLVRASIEVEHKRTQTEYIAVECQGQDYAFFQWECYARSSIGPNFRGIFRPRPIVYGLTIFTRNEKITVEVNGDVHVHPLTVEEKKFQFKEHSN